MHVCMCAANIQEIINITQTLEKYGKKEAIDSGFIQRFWNKLSRENRRWVTMKMIDNYDDFVAALYEMLTVNDELKITYIEKIPHTEIHSALVCG